MTSCFCHFWMVHPQLHHHLMKEVTLALLCVQRKSQLLLITTIKQSQSIQADAENYVYIGYPAIINMHVYQLEDSKIMLQILAVPVKVCQWLLCLTNANFVKGYCAQVSENAIVCKLLPSQILLLCKGSELLPAYVIVGLQIQE